MVYADDIRKVILRLAHECGTDKTVNPSDVARAVDLENWRAVLDQVQLVADILVQEGKIAVTESGDIKSSR